MTWKFYGAWAGGIDRVVYRDIHGPMPQKRWVWAPGERETFRRRKYRHVSKRWPRPPCADINADLQAETYARWLAQRDGIEIPEGLAARVDWVSVDSKWETIGRHFWNGTRQVPKTFKRARSVDFCVVARERSRWGNGRDELGETVVTIQIPHWDWEAAPAVEEVCDARLCA